MRTLIVGVLVLALLQLSQQHELARAAKKGLAVYGTSACSDIQLLTNISWVYNWQTTPGVLEDCYNQLGIQFVPMIWGAKSDFSNVYGNSPYLLTFNEPNFPDQSNLTPQQAASLWPQVEAVASKYKMQISSPSAAYGGSMMDPLKWLDQFFAACTGCKVDFITTHQYDCNYNGLHGAITNFYKYNRSVWVTEFSCYGSSEQADVTFVRGIVPLFDSDPKITRYSYFGSRSNPPSNIDVFAPTTSALTEVGVAYNG